MALQVDGTRDTLWNGINLIILIQLGLPQACRGDGPKSQAFEKFPHVVMSGHISFSERHIHTVLLIIICTVL